MMTRGGSMEYGILGIAHHTTEYFWEPDFVWIRYGFLFIGSFFLFCLYFTLELVPAKSIPLA